MSKKHEVLLFKVDTLYTASTKLLELHPEVLTPGGLYNPTVGRRQAVVCVSNTASVVHLNKTSIACPENSHKTLNNKRAHIYKD